MSEPSISVIVPTVGRVSLAATLDALTPQLGERDEVLVVGDGPQPLARILAQGRGLRYMHTAPSRSWGNAQRDYGIARARGDYVAFCDDDDIFTPDALAHIRTSAQGIPMLYRMQHPTGLLWREPVLRHANVGTPMFVAPRDGRLATWADSPDQYAADFWFISHTLRNHGNVVWKDKVICQCRTQSASLTN